MVNNPVWIVLSQFLNNLLRQGRFAPNYWSNVCQIHAELCQQGPIQHEKGSNAEVVQCHVNRASVVKDFLLIVLC